MNNFDGAEVTIYLKDGTQLAFDLSEIQLAVISKVLNLKYNSNNQTISYMSDENLKKAYTKLFD